MGIHANPEHFQKAMEHGLKLLEKGYPRGILMTMANGMANRGKTDAADGYMHLYLHCLVGDGLQQDGYHPNKGLGKKMLDNYLEHMSPASPEGQS